MDFIRRFIEQKISVATGELVRFDKFSFSPLSGVVEVRDLSVGTFLTVKRIEAKIAVARALKQEIVIRSLVIEGPTITIARTGDGKTNLPSRPARSAESEPTEARKSWEFEAHKALLVGGRVAYFDASGYQVSLENLTGSVEMKSPSEAEFIFAADSLGRRDRAVELGEARLIGKVAGGLNFTLSAGSLLDLSARTPGLGSGRWDGEIILAMSLPTLLALLPQAVRLPITSATGDARLCAEGSFDRATGAIALHRFELRTGPVTVR
jgi:hypothetical protein